MKRKGIVFQPGLSGGKHRDSKERDLAREGRGRVSKPRREQLLRFVVGGFNIISQPFIRLENLF